MKQIYIIYNKGTHEAKLVREKRIYKIEDNQNEEVNKLHFIDELVALGTFNDMYFNSNEGDNKV